MSDTGLHLLVVQEDLRSARKHLDLAIERHKVTELVKNSPLTWMHMHRASVTLRECTEAVERALNTLQVDQEET